MPSHELLYDCGCLILSVILPEVLDQVDLESILLSTEHSSDMLLDSDSCSGLDVEQNCSPEPGVVTLVKYLANSLSHPDLFQKLEDSEVPLNDDSRSSIKNEPSPCDKSLVPVLLENLFLDDQPPLSVHKLELEVSLHFVEGIDSEAEFFVVDQFVFPGEEARL